MATVFETLLGGAFFFALESLAAAGGREVWLRGFLVADADVADDAGDLDEDCLTGVIEVVAVAGDVLVTLDTSLGGMVRALARASSNDLTNRCAICRRSLPPCCSDLKVL